MRDNTKRTQIHTTINFHIQSSYFLVFEKQHRCFSSCSHFAGKYESAMAYDKPCAYRFGSMIYILNQSMSPYLLSRYLMCSVFTAANKKKHLKTIVTVFKGHMHRNIQWQIWFSANFLDIDKNLMHTFIHRHCEIKKFAILFRIAYDQIFAS